MPLDKTQKENTRTKITNQQTARITFLQQSIVNETAEFNASIKIKQDEIDALTLQSDALIDFKIE